VAVQGNVGEAVLGWERGFPGNAFYSRAKTEKLRSYWGGERRTRKRNVRFLNRGNSISTNAVQTSIHGKKGSISGCFERRRLE